MNSSKSKSSTGTRKKPAPRKAAARKAAPRKAEPREVTSARPDAAPAPGGGIEHEQIAELAHSLWRARGCPVGQDEQIWLEAEAQLREAAGRS